jgi:hypothetical protein
MESIGSILGDMSIEERHAMHIGLVSWLEVLQAFTRVEASVLASTGGVQVRGLRAFTLTMRRGAAAKSSAAAKDAKAGKAAVGSMVEVTVEVMTGGEPRSKPKALCMVVRAPTIPILDVAHTLGRLASTRLTGAEISKMYGFRIRWGDGSLLRTTVCCERRVVLDVRAHRTCIVCDEIAPPLAPSRAVMFVGEPTRQFPKNAAICESHEEASLWGVRFTLPSPLDAPPVGPMGDGSALELAALELAVVPELCPFEQIKHMPKWRMSAWQARATTPT